MLVCGVGWEGLGAVEDGGGFVDGFGEELELGGDEGGGGGVAVVEGDVEDVEGGVEGCGERGELGEGEGGGEVQGVRGGGGEGGGALGGEGGEGEAHVLFWKGGLLGSGLVLFGEDVTNRRKDDRKNLHH